MWGGAVMLVVFCGARPSNEVTTLGPRMISNGCVFDFVDEK